MVSEVSAASRARQLLRDAAESYRFAVLVGVAGVSAIATGEVIQLAAA